MRIVTRPDFDGIVCAVLLKDALDITDPIRWIEPGDMQKGLVDIGSDEIIANLPYDHRCALWFDHHYSNRPDGPFEGAFNIAPSAAGIVHKHYAKNLTGDYTELVRAADKIDSADLNMDEVLKPENYPYVLLSMTVSGQDPTGPEYWDALVDLLGKIPINRVLSNPEVKSRCRLVISQNSAFKEVLLNHTTVKGHVAITDLRSFCPVPSGNRFLVYSLFPETVVSVKIRYHDTDPQKVIIGAGHSIFNRNCRVNIGQMLSKFEGGGHMGAGACSFHISKLDAYLPKIMDILLKNKPLKNG